MQINAVQKWIAWAAPAQKLPVQLTQRRIYIFPTKSGFFFGILTLAMLVGAVNYSLSLGHALVFLLIGFGLISMLHSFRNLLGLRLIDQHPSAVFVGEDALFGAQIINESGLERVGLCAGLDREPRARFNIPARSHRLIQIPIKAHHRGRMAAPRLTLSSLYPVGFFRAWSYFQPQGHCLVYPAPIYRPMIGLRAEGKAAVGLSKSGSEDFSGLRNRQANDSLKAVAWKTSARSPQHQPLMIKQFDGESAGELIFAWDCLATEDTETKLSILCGWVLQADREKLRYGLYLPTGRIGPSDGLAHRNECLTKLALFGQDG